MIKHCFMPEPNQIREIVVSTLTTDGFYKTKKLITILKSFKLNCDELNSQKNVYCTVSIY